MSLPEVIGTLTRRFTAFRVTKEEYEFIDKLAKKQRLGKGVNKGHSHVLRQAIAALKEKVELS